MLRRISRAGVGLGLIGALALIATGCGQSDTKGGQVKDKGKGTPVAEAKKGEEKKAHDHSGWWCDEHGIPEGECSMCSAKVAKECKAKGDWCDKHDRAKSQCFICNPERKEFYAAQYRAKLGKEPPPIEDEEKGKKDGK